MLHAPAWTKSVKYLSLKCLVIAATFISVDAKGIDLKFFHGADGINIVARSYDIVATFVRVCLFIRNHTITTLTFVRSPSN